MIDQESKVEMVKIVHLLDSRLPSSLRGRHWLVDTDWLAGVCLALCFAAGQFFEIASLSLCKGHLPIFSSPEITLLFEQG